MTRVRVGDLLLWIAAAIVAGFGVTVSWPRSQTGASKAVVHEAPAAPRALIDSQLGPSIAKNAVSDPFGGAVAVVEPSDDSEEIQERVTSDPSDQMTLSGVAGGPPWLALIGNTETRRTQVAVVGDTLGLVRVISVARDSVVLETPLGVRVLHIRVVGQ